MNPLATATHAPPSPPAPGGEFLRDVLRGLARPRKELPCKYFYDEAGSRLFDRICELPEYYPTRCERSILERHAGRPGLVGRQRFRSGPGGVRRCLAKRMAELRLGDPELQQYLAAPHRDALDQRGGFRR